jgi:hypothetical protein
LIELFIAFIVGMILGYVLKGEKQIPFDNISTNQVEKLKEDIEYYKNLTKKLVDENMEFRRKQ